jgi:hypothetical protein
MSGKAPPTIVEGSLNANDVEEETPQQAKSAEDRKAANALAKLDAPRDDDAPPAKEVDQEAVSKAMKSLGDAGKKSALPKKEVKNVKVDPEDVALVVSVLFVYRLLSWPRLEIGEVEMVMRTRERMC